MRVSLPSGSSRDDASWAEKQSPAQLKIGTGETAGNVVSGSEESGSKRQCMASIFLARTDGVVGLMQSQSARFV
jgi:hypothetical protein